MVGDCVGKAQGRRPLSFPDALHGHGSCLEAGSNRLEAGRNSLRVVSTGALRAKSRSSLSSPSNHAGDQTSRTLDFGQQHEKIHSRRQTESRIFQSPSTSATAVHQAGAAIPTGGPKIFHPPVGHSNQKYTLELFSGCACLSKAFYAAQGYTAVAYDIEYGAACDLLQERVVQSLLHSLVWNTMHNLEPRPPLMVVHLLCEMMPLASWACLVWDVTIKPKLNKAMLCWP